MVPHPLFSWTASEAPQLGKHKCFRYRCGFLCASSDLVVARHGIDQGMAFMSIVEIAHATSVRPFNSQDASWSALDTTSVGRLARCL